MKVLANGCVPQPPPQFEPTEAVRFIPPLPKRKVLATGLASQPPPVWDAMTEWATTAFDPPLKCLASGRPPRPPAAWKPQENMGFSPPIRRLVPLPSLEVKSPLLSSRRRSPGKSVIQGQPSAKASFYEVGRRLTGLDGAQWECMIGPDFAAHWNRVSSVPEISAAAEEVEADPMDVSGLAVRQVVLARGLGPSGAREWFRARVDKFRQSFPPIVVTYVATHPAGETHALALPEPKVAYVHKGDVKLLSDSADDGQKLSGDQAPCGPSADDPPADGTRLTGVVGPLMVPMSEQYSQQQASDLFELAGHAEAAPARAAASPSNTRGGAREDRIQCSELMSEACSDATAVLQ